MRVLTSRTEPRQDELKGMVTYLLRKQSVVRDGVLQMRHALTIMNDYEYLLFRDSLLETLDELVDDLTELD